MEREVKNTSVELFCKKIERGHIILGPVWQRKSVRLCFGRERSQYSCGMAIGSHE